MSFCNQMAAAIDGARTLTRLDDLSRSIWQGLAAGAVGDDDAQALAERLHARRSLIRGDLQPVGIPTGRASIFPPRRLQRAPKRPVVIARRRHLAASGPMPPSLACRFTVGELAVLRIVGDEVRQHGRGDRCVDEIAARAGVCRSLVKNAIRTAARLGLLTVEERRREGRRNLPNGGRVVRREGGRNLPNVVRILSREWLAWLARGSKPIGVRKVIPTAKETKREPSRTSEAVFAAGGQRAERGALGRDSDFI